MLRPREKKRQTEKNEVRLSSLSVVIFLTTTWFSHLARDLGAMAVEFVVKERKCVSEKEKVNLDGRN